MDYVTRPQNRFVNWRLDYRSSPASFVDDCFVPTFVGPFCAPEKVEPLSLLSPACWHTQTRRARSAACSRLRLTVEATDGSTYCDTQRVWLDNKNICVRIRIDAVPKCADLNVSQFALPPDCSVEWRLPVSGIAYDPTSIRLAPLTRPNDNFDYYTVTVTKQGGPSLQIPVPVRAGQLLPRHVAGRLVHTVSGRSGGGDVYGTLDDVRSTRSRSQCNASSCRTWFRRVSPWSGASVASTPSRCRRGIARF